MDWRREYKYLFIISGIHFFFLNDILFRDYAYLCSDLRDYFSLCHFTVYTWIENGVFPLWNYFIGCGTLNAGLFMLEPINLLLYSFLPLASALSWNIALNSILGGIFAYLFARSISLPPAPSFLSAICFTMSGYYVAQGIIQISGTHSLAFLPLGLYIVERSLAKTRKSVSLLWLTPVLTIQMIGSHPQVTLYSDIALFLYFIFRLYSLRQRGALSLGTSMRYACFFTVSVVLFIVMSSVVIIPLYEWIQQGIRGESLSFTGSGSLNPLSLITFVFPNFYGISSSEDPNYWGKGFMCWSILGYMGIFPLILSTIAIFYKAGRNFHIRFFIFLALLSLLIALGKYNPFFFVIGRLPFLNLTRQPDRILMLYVFSVAILTGWGFKHILGGVLPRVLLVKVQRGIIYFFVASCLLVVAVHVSLGWYGDLVVNFFKNYFKAHYYGHYPFDFRPIEYYYGEIDSYPQKILSTVSFTYPYFLMTLFLLGAAFWVLSLVINRRIGGNKLKYIIILCTIAPLFYAGKTYYRPESRQVLDEPPGVVTYMQNNSYNEKYRILTTQRIMGLKREPSDYGVRKDWLVPPSNTLYGIHSTNDIGMNVLKRYYSLIPPLINGTEEEILSRKHILDLLNVKYIITYGKFSHKDLREVYKDGDLKVYENATFLPRAFLATRVEVVPDEAEVLDRLLDPSFDARKTVLVEKEIPLKFSNPPGSSRVSNICYGTNSLSIDVEAYSDAFLFVSDTYYPGWRCFVDDKEVKIYRANYAFRGVVVPKGRHQVVFRFEPWTVRIGLYTSLFSLMAFAGIILYSRKSMAQQ